MVVWSYGSYGPHVFSSTNYVAVYLFSSAVTNGNSWTENNFMLTTMSTKKDNLKFINKVNTDSTELLRYRQKYLQHLEIR